MGKKGNLVTQTSGCIQNTHDYSGWFVCISIIMSKHAVHENKGSDHQLNNELSSVDVKRIFPRKEMCTRDQQMGLI